MGNSCGKLLWKILWEIVVGECLWEIAAGKSCRKFLWDKEEGKKTNLRKALIGGNLAFGIGGWGAKQSRFSSENLVGKSCRKFLLENFAGNSSVAGNSYCGKLLWEILAGNCCRKSCRKLLRENLVGNSCSYSKLENLACSKFLKLLWENAVGNCCGKILQILVEILVGISYANILAGQGGGEEANLRKAVIGGNLAFGIG